MTSEFPLGRRCPGVVVARYFEGCAPRQNVHSFGSAVIRQIHMVPAWSLAKGHVPPTINITRIEDLIRLRALSSLQLTAGSK